MKSLNNAQDKAQMNYFMANLKVQKGSLEMGLYPVENKVVFRGIRV